MQLQPNLYPSLSSAAPFPAEKPSRLYPSLSPSGLTTGGPTFPNENPSPSPLYPSLTPIELTSETVLPIEKSPLIQTETVSKVKSVAKTAFIQLGIALAVNLTIMTFIATPITMAVLTGALIGALTSAIIQSTINLFIQSKALEIDEEKIDSVKNLAQASMINTVGLAGPNIGIHEVGHAAAALACFQKSNPSIQIFPFLGGVTSYTFSHGLTRFGSFLGQHHAQVFIASAGFLASTFFAMFEFGLADRLHDDYPTLSRCLNVHGVLQIAQEVLYGLTAFIASKSDLAHDFVNLWMTQGIHPLIPIGLMVLLPLAEIWLLRFLASRESSQKVHAIAMQAPGSLISA